MNVHVFGNSPSPAVATFGLRKSACNRENHETCDDVCNFVHDDFYVDDGLVSLPDEESAVQLIKNTQEALKKGGNLRLHKLSSNSINVLSRFQNTELAKNLTEIDFESSSPNLQRSLGLIWNIELDTFTYSVSSEEKPFTRRGMLSTVNSIFDPLGFVRIVAPVILGGKIILRNALIESTDWDKPLPSNLLSDWESWKSSLSNLGNLQIPRTYSDISLQQSVRKELHIFSDASKEAIGAVAYMEIFDTNGFDKQGFIMGKSKLAPGHGHTIPRLELCAAVLAVEIASFIHEQLHISVDLTRFYTDSKVVLGYINNESRRFYVYVSNRVDRIRRFTSPDQWSYVPTNLNPADQATRPLHSGNIQDSLWLRGPSLLINESEPEQYDLINPEQDNDLRPDCFIMQNSTSGYTWNRSIRTIWSRLISAVSFLKQKSAQRHVGTSCERTIVDFIEDSKKLILKEVQLELYSKEIKCLKNNDPLPKDSSLLPLSPILDTNDLLRVGGRLIRSNLPYDSKNPIIVSSKHHISTLLVRYYHEKIHHQGRHITEGSVRSAGYWITGGKRLISSIIHNCVRCRKLRRNTEHQKMSDLPEDRLNPGPPFTHVGVDTFGPWTIITRRTRGGQAYSKRWAIMFSCLVSRGIHIEVVDELSSSSFINALKRFTSLRGPVKEFRSDRGTNFVGATDDLEMEAINVEDKSVQNLLNDNRTVWKFNSPHSSHMAVAWERMIAITRRILDSLLSNTPAKGLTQDVLCTFMAEVCAIVNARPLVAVSSDPIHLQFYHQLL